MSAPSLLKSFMTSPNPLVRLIGIRKAFPGVLALDGVDFDVLPGEVHALMGENGAGKSTLMKILSGAYQPDSGLIEIDGVPVRLHSPAEAARLGIGMIYQELTVLPNLDVGRNLLLGREPLTRWGQIDYGKLYTESRRILADLDLDIDPRAPLESLSLGQRQMVEIARVVASNPRVLIMDEPTSSLGRHEEEVLFELVRKLRARGVGIVYISHRMDEVFLLADRVTVLRDGKRVVTQPIGMLSRGELIRLMVGRDIARVDHVRRVSESSVVLEARHIRLGKRLRDASIVLREGEVVGVAGLVGAGRTQLARVLFGIDKPEAGEIFIEGRLTKFRGPWDAIRAGIAYVPEDRKGLGLVLCASVSFNMVLPSLAQFSRFGVLQRRRIAMLCREWMKRLKIRTPSPSTIVENLSGGNQQKVVLAKWLARKPRVLILNEPTRGIDVGAKSEVHALIREVASQGVAIMMISSELPEVMLVSDRIVVMWNGYTVGELEAQSAREEDILLLAFGEKREKQEV